MFGRAAAASIALILTIGIGAYFLLIPVNQKDRAAYAQLVAESAAIHSKCRVKSQTIRPFRTEVQKDIWSTDESHSRHLCFKADSSQLFIQPSGAILALTEESVGCEGTIVDGVSHYTFKSDKARYEEKTLELKGQVSILHPDGEIEADKAALSPKSIVLRSRVKIRDRSVGNKESYAVADLVEYSSADQMFFLLGDGMNRVLFWQEGLSMSAPEVRVSRETGLVKGIGDVHFSFDLDEENEIAELFAKYL